MRATLYGYQLGCEPKKFDAFENPFLNAYMHANFRNYLTLGNIKRIIADLKENKVLNTTPETIRAFTVALYWLQNAYEQAQGETVLKSIQVAYTVDQ